MPNLLAIHNATGSRLYRIIPQAKYMADKGWNVKVRGLKAGQTGGVGQDLLEWADVVLVEMTYSPQFIRAIKKTGAKVVYEIDDLMEQVNKMHYAHKDMNWWRTWMTYHCLHMVDAIICTVEPLKQHYKWFNSNIHVLPNYLDLEFWEKPYLKNTSDTIRLGWIGGNSHKEDLLFLAPIIKRVLEKYDNVKFLCTGYGGSSTPNSWVEFNYGENLFKNLPPEKYEFSLGAPMEVFPSKIPAMRLDIALAPVIENVFSKCKSNCKAQEYGINRIPGVYQRFLYKDAVIDGETGYLATSAEEWYEKICQLVEMEKGKREQMGENAYDHIKKNFSFRNKASQWEEVFNKLANV